MINLFLIILSAIGLVFGIYKYIVSLPKIEITIIKWEINSPYDKNALYAKINVENRGGGTVTIQRSFFEIDGYENVPIETTPRAHLNKNNKTPINYWAKQNINLIGRSARVVVVDTAGKEYRSSKGTIDPIDASDD